jgi:hypothetical protein
MERLPDTDQALLPIDHAACTCGPGVPAGHGHFQGCPRQDWSQGAALVPAKVAHLHKAGILLPETQDALDWLWRNRATNGYAEAFRMVGGRRCIDLVAFARITRSKPA